MSVAELSPMTAGQGRTRRRRLFVVWQNPNTRAFAQVGALVQDDDGGYAFRYLRRALRLPGFHPLTSFPRLDTVYRSVKLPPFFDNRLMSRRRPDFAGYLRAMDLTADEATPFELLARTGGSRATDTFHVVAEPEISPDGRARTRFLASGVRWVEGAGDRIAHLSPGAILTLRPETTNPKNPHALLIDTTANEPVGYVPDWLLDVVRQLVGADPDYQLVAERASGPETPSHLRLLCRLEAELPVGVDLFADPDFDYVTG